MSRADVVVTLFDLKGQINDHLNHIVTRSLNSVGYLRPSMESNRSFWLTQMKLHNDDDVRLIYSIFGQHSLYGPIEFDASLARSFRDIRESLIKLMTYEEIKASMDRPYI